MYDIGCIMLRMEKVQHQLPPGQDLGIYKTYKKTELSNFEYQWKRKFGKTEKQFRVHLDIL